MNYQTTREELYSEIWEEPISKVCKKYNVSDNAIRKKCIALNIPMPDNSYWINRRLGKQVTKRPLPRFSGEDKIVFQIKDTTLGPDAIIKKKADFYYFDGLEKEKIIKIYKHLHVKTCLESPHKYIVEHCNFWDKCVKSKVDLVHIFKGLHENSRRSSLFNSITQAVNIIDTYSVSKGQINRAYLIYDSLIKAFELCGFIVSVKPFYADVTIRGETIQLRMREKYDKVAIKERGYSWTKYEYNPKGELVFMFKSSIDYNFCEVHESKNCPLEQKIQIIFKKICDKVESAKIEIKEREARHKLYELMRKKEEEVEKIHEKEKVEVRNLIIKAKQFMLSQEIREYAKNLKTKTDDDLRYYQWVIQKSDWFDPNLNVEDKILNEKDKEVLSVGKFFT